METHCNQELLQMQHQQQPQKQESSLIDTNFNFFIPLDEERIQSTKDLKINANDVLCGRGKTSFNHAGNRRFRDIITASLCKYNNAHSRLEKSMVVNNIVASIHTMGGRFLKEDRSHGKWKELDTRQAREKVGHAIRDSLASIESRKKKQSKKNQGAVMFNNSYNKTKSTAAVNGIDKINAILDNLSTKGNNMHDTKRFSWSSSGSNNSLCGFENHDDAKMRDKKDSFDIDDIDGHFLSQINDALGPIETDDDWDKEDSLQLISNPC